MSHKIHLLTDIADITKLYNFIRQFPLDYPDYFQWVKKCKRELELDYKQAFYATDLNGEIIGSIIFQPHKKDKYTLEIKNFRVDSKDRQKGIGTLLEAAVNYYAKEKGLKRIQGDSDPENNVVNFLQKIGYKIEAHEALYTAKKEIILVRDI